MPPNFLNRILAREVRAPRLDYAFLQSAPAIALLAFTIACLVVVSSSLKDEAFSAVEIRNNSEAVSFNKHTIVLNDGGAKTVSVPDPTEDDLVVSLSYVRRILNNQAASILTYSLAFWVPSITGTTILGNYYNLERRSGFLIEGARVLLISKAGGWLQV